MKEMDYKFLTSSPITAISLNKKQFLLNEVEIKDQTFFKNSIKYQQNEDSLFLSSFQKYRKLSYESTNQDMLNKSYDKIDEKNQYFFKVEKNNTQHTSKKTGCNCSKSSCLRLHCRCFKTQQMCNEYCGCTDCFNNQENEQIRNFVLDKTKIISRASFQDLVTEVNGKKIIRRGCKCKGNCQQNYCACKKNSTQCSTICQCSSCLNNKIELTKEQVLQIYKYLPRKKYKLSMKFDGQEQNKKRKLSGILFEGYREAGKQKKQFFINKK